MKDKNLNILSPWTSNPLPYIIYNGIVLIWTVKNQKYASSQLLILFFKRDVTKFRIPPPLATQCHTSSPSTPLSCDVIYGCPLMTSILTLFFLK